MKFRGKMATMALAVGVAIGGSAALAAPASAGYIPKTWNGGADMYYGYTDSTNKFCITKHNHVSPYRIGVKFYNSRGVYVGEMATTSHLTKCLTVTNTIIRENELFKFKLYNSRGASSTGYVTS